MGWTTEQEKVIYDRNGNLLVSASAGSGKTTVMIERILELIKEGVSVSNMLICTFTKAAASDMRDKLATALLNCALDGDKRAEAQLALLPTAEISTIHSWCQRMIRKYFYEIDIDPAFEILDENEATAMLEEAIEEAIQEALDRNEERFSLFYEIMQSNRSDRALRAIVRQIYTFTCAQADPDKFLSTAFFSKEREEKAKEIIADEKRKFCERFEPHILKMHELCEKKGYDKILPYLVELLSKVRGENYETMRMPSATRKEPESYEILRQQARKLKELIDKEYEKLNLEYAMENEGLDFSVELISLVRRVKEIYSTQKRKIAKLDYSDLEHFTETLMQNEQIAYEASQEFKYVFVDEYQDVNPLQESVLSKLKGSQIFLVGDVKQSIYAFRMCDPNIFIDKYNNYKERGFQEPIELNHNFRSSSSVIEFTNWVMSSIMTKRFGKIDYAHDAMLTEGLGDDTILGEVKAKVILKESAVNPYDGVYSVEKNTSVSVHTADEAEANLIVRDVIEKLKGKNSDGTPIKPSDIAILFSSRSKKTALIYRKLKKLGVSVSMCDRDSFSSVYEVSVLCSFIKYLTDFTDDISLVALLRSPLVDISDGELALIKLNAPQAEKRYHYSCKLYASQKTDETARKLNEFYELCERYLKLSYSRTCSELIGQLVAEKKWFLNAFASDDAGLKADAINAFLQHLASLPQAKSVRSYAEYLKRGNADFVPLPTGDSVRMMTIHASKGLEFPHVLLIDTAKQFSLRELYGKVICDDELGVCLKSFDFDNRKELKTLYTVASSFKLKRKLLEERMRLLYVALTRAKETLCLYATVKENDDFFGGVDFDFEYRDPESKHNFFSWMWDSIIPLEYEKIGSYETVRANSCVEVVKTEKASKVEEPSIETVKALKDYFAMDEIYAQKYSTERKRVKSSVTAMMEMHDEEENIHYLSGADDDRAIKKGNAYHKAMEIIDFEKDFDAEWERIKGTYDIEALVDKEKLKIAVKKIKELTLGKKVYREKPFMLCDGGQLIQGIIDLMVVNGNECVIVDYKTSSVARIDSGAYDLQLSVYAKAVSVVLGVKVTSAAVYSFEKGDFAFVKLKE